MYRMGPKHDGSDSEAAARQAGNEAARAGLNTEQAGRLAEDWGEAYRNQAPAARHMLANAWEGAFLTGYVHTNREREADRSETDPPAPDGELMQPPEGDAPGYGYLD